MARTYLPTLKFLLEKVCKYIADHRTRIVEVIGEENSEKLDAVITACNILTLVLDAILPPPV